MITDTLTLAGAMDVLAREIHCEDGVATAAIAEAARRLREQREILVRADGALDNCRVGKAAPVRVNIASCIK
jgi:hypothetical protein